MAKGFYSRWGFNRADVPYIVAFVGLAVVAVAVLFGLATVWGAYQCEAVWADYQPRYSPVTGCTVQSDFGGRIPAKNFLVR